MSTRRRFAAVLAVAPLAPPLVANAGTDTEANKETARRWFADVLSDGDLSAIGEIVAADFRPQDPDDVPGRDALAQRTADDLADRERGGATIRYEPETFVAEGEYVTVAGRIVGTVGAAALDVPFLSLLTFADGLIVAALFLFDETAFAAQMAGG